ncbi:helix-turn-helix domain-containing protein, partial [Gardnerella pickettii]|uniref:AlbA family DNA-binding domain-containing protein n=1 Tax=Gardnerella pickettii TaxID=2914924 RepID=UPI0039F12290
MILPENLMNLIRQGEGLTVEFKKSTTDITKDVYDTVCSFSNRDGGHIFFGVKDNGTILGVDKDCVEQMKKNFVTTINNERKMYPPLYLTTEEYEIDGRIVLYVYVPVGKTVYRNAGRIFDRNNESDIDITDNADMVFNLYARKQSTYFVNKVYPAIPVSSLRHDLMNRARRMTRVNTEHHPWVDMTDEEMLRSCGLILEDPETNQEGITLAAVLLFGTNNRIMSVLPQHKTDAIFRVFNVDRYDDRDVVITNLIESYDRLMEFGKKHL